MKKDIKVKPKGAPPKIREAVSLLPKDAKAVMREELTSKAEKLKPEFKDQSQENATDYATGKVEGGMRRGAEKSAKSVNQASVYAVRKVKERRQSAKTQPNTASEITNTEEVRPEKAGKESGDRPSRDRTLAGSPSICIGKITRIRPGSTERRQPY